MKNGPGFKHCGFRVSLWVAILLAIAYPVAAAYALPGLTIERVALRMTQPEVVKVKGEPAKRRVFKKDQSERWEYVGNITVLFRPVRGQSRVCGIAGNSLEKDGELICKVQDNLGGVLFRCNQLGHCQEQENQDYSGELRYYQVTDSLNGNLFLIFRNLKLYSISIDLPEP